MRGEPAQKPTGLSRGAQLLTAWRGKRLQTEAAAELGVDPVTYNRLERGTRKPSMRVSIQIERGTAGKVSIESWCEPPRKKRASA
jgi:hypothetical protein